MAIIKKIFFQIIKYFSIYIIIVLKLINLKKNEEKNNLYS